MRRGGGRPPSPTLPPLRGGREHSARRGFRRRRPKPHAALSWGLTLPPRSGGREREARGGGPPAAAPTLPVGTDAGPHPPPPERGRTDRLSGQERAHRHPAARASRLLAAKIPAQQPEIVGVIRSNPNPYIHLVRSVLTK